MRDNMAIVIRIVSTDGRRTIMKSLPGLPAHLKVPAGARVEVVEDGRTISLAQYVNEHANRQNPDQVLENAKVDVETVNDWSVAEAWLDSLGGSEAVASNAWFSDASDGRESNIMGVDVDGLLIGGAIAAGVAFGTYELTRTSKPKDSTAPVAPTGLDLAAEDDTGSSTTDNITSKTTGLTITGTAEAGSVIELFNGTTSLGTVTANAQGKFTKDVDLAGGTHSVTARSTDTAGNVSAAATVLSIVVDSSAPAAPAALDLAVEDDTGTSTTDNVTDKTSALTISGTGDAGTVVELFDGSTSLGTVTVGTNGTFSRDISLSPGVHSITARATDSAGNLGTSSAPLEITVTANATFALDLAADDDSGASNTDNITSKGTELTITGTSAANATIEFFDDKTSIGTAATDGDGKFSKDFTLASGAHPISAKVVGGDAVSNTITIVVDTTAPIALTAPDLAAADDAGPSNIDDVTNKTTALTFTGTATGNANVEMFVDGVSVGTTAVRTNGSYTKDIDLGEGVHSIAVKAIDAAGNVGEISPALQVTVDTTAPSAPLSLDLASEDDNGASNTDNSTSLTSGLTVSGTAEIGSIVEFFDGTTSLGAATAGANGAYSKDLSLAIGSHAITTKASDVAGNVSAASAGLTITVVEATPASALSATADSHFASSAMADYDPLGGHISDASTSFG
jgi:hypothetical protein